jgi:coenzyme F420 hydrogenase subunit beta
MLATMVRMSSNFAPIFWQPSGKSAPHRGLCTDCGVSRLSGAVPADANEVAQTIDANDCGSVCQFIKPNYPALEARVHGRSRDPNRADELHFGPIEQMVRAKLAAPLAGAQWTGITTRLAERLLETRQVDAVLTMAPDPNDSWRPVPVLVRTAADLRQCRGMRMGYAPLLSLLEPAIAQGVRKLAVIGIPCQVYALRGLEEKLQLDSLFVIGTPCSDNTTTERFHEFLQLLGENLRKDPADITYLEFRADYHVELRFKNGQVKAIPFLQLPLSKLPSDFFPMTCKTCVDYTNVLSDITVGYMGGSGEQWLIARNEKGQKLLALLGHEVVLSQPLSAGKRQGPVKGFLKNVELAAGGLPVRSMPDWLRPIVGWLMPKVGPKGLEFARARVEMKALETVVNLRRAHPAKIKNMVPSHVWSLVKPYGLSPSPSEVNGELVSRPATGNVEDSARGE